MRHATSQPIGDHDHLGRGFDVLNIFRCHVGIALRRARDVLAQPGTDRRLQPLPGTTVVANAIGRAAIPAFRKAARIPNQMSTVLSASPDDRALVGLSLLPARLR